MSKILDEVLAASILEQPVVTERLIIRKFEPEDWCDVFAYTSDAKVMAYIPEGTFATQAEAQQFVAKNMRDEAEAFPRSRSAPSPLSA